MPAKIPTANALDAEVVLRREGRDGKPPITVYRTTVSDRQISGELLRAAGHRADEFADEHPAVVGLVRTAASLAAEALAHVHATRFDPSSPHYLAVCEGVFARLGEQLSEAEVVMASAVARAREEGTADRLRRVLVEPGDDALVAFYHVGTGRIGGYLSMDPAGPKVEATWALGVDVVRDAYADLTGRVLGDEWTVVFGLPWRDDNEEPVARRVVGRTPAEALAEAIAPFIDDRTLGAPLTSATLLGRLHSVGFRQGFGDDGEFLVLDADTTSSAFRRLIRDARDVRYGDRWGADLVLLSWDDLRSTAARSWRR